MKWALTRKKDTNLSPFEEFERDVKKLFDDFFELTPSDLFDSQWMPTVDVEEDEKSLHIKAEIPGINEKDLNVSIEDNMLIISGEKKHEHKEENKRYILSERKFGSFKRCIQLPENINLDSAKATFKNGVLNIDFEKKEVAKPKKIEVKVK